MANCINNLSVLLLFLFVLQGCKNEIKEYKSPAGYDLNKPEKFGFNKELNEVSGIGFLNGNVATAIAIADEKGKLYSFSVGKENFTASKFSKKGDYEDVAILNNKEIVVLRSDGSLFLFPVDQLGKENIDSVEEYNNILPAGEYEGLASANGKLFALCKNCSGDKEKKEVSVYTLEQNQGAPLSVTNAVKIDISMTQPENDNEKMKFHPSCLAKHPITGDWVIISSVNKLLLLLDEAWKVKAHYSLDPALFKQPEGMAFDSKGNLYISNEGGGGAANLLLFPYKKQ